MLVPRMVGFDTTGKAVGAGFSSAVERAHSHKVMSLPSQHVDFIDYNVVGKTEAEIRTDLERVF